MKLLLNKKMFIKILLIFSIISMAVYAGIYYGYRRGYDVGTQKTNSWWIDKQSRYYDSSEVEKKHLSRHHNLI